MLAGLADGLLQITAPTHLLAIAAMGLLAAQGTRSIVVMLALFALGLLAGSFAIALAIRETPSALTLLGIAAFAGTVVAAAVPLPPILKNVLALALGAALALNTPPQAINISSAIATQIGTGAATIAALALIMLIAMQAARRWQHVGLCILGSWIAAIAILALALRLVR
jgi:hypothetical protein